MDLKHKIKEAMSTRKIKSKWSSYTQPNIYELDSFLIKSGYSLVDILITKGSGTIELIIEPIKNNVLHPEINHAPAEKVFMVMVKDYGELIASDLEEVITGYQNALGVVKYLDSVDLSKLEVNE